MLPPELIVVIITHNWVKHNYQKKTTAILRLRLSLASVERFDAQFAVPEMRCSRLRSPHFDRCTNPCSLHPPPAALAGVARGARTARVQTHIYKKENHPGWGGFPFGGDGEI